MPTAEELITTTENYYTKLETAVVALNGRAVWALSQRIKELTEQMAKLGYKYTKPKKRRPEHKNPPGKGKNQGKSKIYRLF